jgi:predicted amidohydrolase
MRVAAYQCRLLLRNSPARPGAATGGSDEAIELIRERVKWCESDDVSILCCPEAILGGLADYMPRPTDLAISAGSLASVLSPLASSTVTTILGFTEIGEEGRLYNTAEVFREGTVVGLYRKHHPAIRKSVYEPGDGMPVFTVNGLTFGILICNDSNFPELARIMATQGATALFVPSNNGLRPGRAHAEVVAAARKADIALALENRVWVIRADVAGRTDELVSYGSSGIVTPGGVVAQRGRQLSEDLIVAEIDTARCD